MTYESIDDIPPEFRRLLLHAMELDEIYARGDVSGLIRECEVWDQILAHPRFPRAPAEFQVFVFNDAAATFVQRYEASGDPRFLHHAIDLLERAPATGDIDLLVNLTNALRERYRIGRIEDLDRARQLAEDALPRQEPGSPAWRSCATSLGLTLIEQHRVTGALDELEQARDLFRQVAVTPHRREEHAAVLNNLGMAQALLYGATRKLALLDDAIQLFHASIAASVPSPGQYPIRLNNLSNALRELHEATGDRETLEGSITIAREAAKWTPRGPGRAMILNAMGASLSRAGDVDAAIGAFGGAIDESEGAPANPLYRLNLARAFVGRGDPRQARRLCEEIAEQQVEHPHGLEAAVIVMELSFTESDFAAVARAHNLVNQSLDVLMRAQAVRGGRERWLRLTQGTSAMAAYALARNGDVNGAAAALERGQAQLLTRALARDTIRLDELARVDPDLAARYRRAASRVQHIEETDLRAQRLAVAAHPPEIARTARQELDAVIRAIRALPAFAEFLRDQATDATAHAGLRPGEALLYVATTIHGSVAIAVTEKLHGILWPSLTLPELESGDLATLGDPITEWLHAHSISKVVLIPAGRLRTIPLHALLLDRFTVSVVPNRAVFEIARARTAQRDATEARLVAVANPRGTEPPLPAAESEVASLKDRFEDATISIGETVDLQALISSLRSATHIHFACHGWFDAEDPLQSGLELGSDRLTVHQLMDGTIRLDAAPLVVLSACVTAMTDPRRLPDEFIGLQAGFIHAGACGVVGSLGGVSDDATMWMMNRFYEQYAASHAPADALRRAQQWLRHLGPFDNPEFWAPFVFCGD